MATEFVTVIKTSEIPAGGITAVDAHGMRVAVANVASVPSLSDPAVFEDFDAIRRLAQSSASDDEELYMVLNK